MCSSQISAGDRIRYLVCGLPSPLRQKRLLLMLQGYFDDSGSDGQQVGFVLAGYILPAERWERFSDEWQEECQREPRISYFKMREAAAGKSGEFQGVPIEFRQYKVRRLLGLIDSHMLHGMTTNLKWDEFRQFDAHLFGPAKNVPYGPLFFGILDNVLAYQKAMGFFPHKVQLDFDEQASAGAFAISSYGAIMKLSERVGALSNELATINDIRSIVEGTPRMLDDKQYPGLQAADMLAWSLRLQMEAPEEIAKSPFSWLYEDLRKAVWGGCMRLGKQNWDFIAQVLINQPIKTY